VSDVWNILHNDWEKSLPGLNKSSAYASGRVQVMYDSLQHHRYLEETLRLRVQAFEDELAKAGAELANTRTELESAGEKLAFVAGHPLLRKVYAVCRVHSQEGVTGVMRAICRKILPKAMR
jgi:hypothetical protein